ncbi:resolvase, partial [Methylococcaceae bacterium CS4]
KLASDFARTVSDIIERYRIKGLSMGNVANELNKLGVKTRRGGKWHASTVKNIIDRQK